MKSSDIKIGETYAYTRYAERGRSLATNPWLSAIKVTDIRQERVHNKTTYGTRVTTLVIGESAGTTIKVEPKYVLATWAEALTAQREYKAAVAKGLEIEGERRTERDRKLARLEQLLAARGVEPTFEDYLDVVYVNKQTGEVLRHQPKDYAWGDDPTWEYTSLSHKTYFDREAILRGKKVEISLDQLLQIVEG